MDKWIGGFLLGICVIVVAILVLLNFMVGALESPDVKIAKAYANRDVAVAQTYAERDVTVAEIEAKRDTDIVEMQTEAQKQTSFAYSVYTIIINLSWSYRLLFLGFLAIVIHAFIKKEVGA